MKIEENVSLKELSTFKIGGPAKYLARVTNSEEVAEALHFAEERGVLVGIMGAGCNLVIADEGIDGLILKMDLQDFSIDQNQIRVGAGVSFSTFLNKVHSVGLVGNEWMPSVPSSIGGGIRGNAGAFGGETKDMLKSVTVYRNNQVVEIDASEIEFSYRYSSFKSPENTDVILGGLFELPYGDVAESQTKVRDNILKKQASQPTGVACSGCIFKNYEGYIDDPSVIEKFPELQDFNARGIIPSGYLIEKAGLKGYRLGGVEVSQKHANYIVNPEKTGKYLDVISLIQVIRNRVCEVFGVWIDEEVVYLHEQMKSR